MKSILILIVILITIYLPVSAEKLLIVRGNGQYPPYEMIKNGALTGFHIEIIEKVCKSANIEFQIKSYPWKRALIMMQTGKADAISYISRNKIRDTYILFMEENILSNTKIAIITHQSKSIDLKSISCIDSLRNYRIGLIRGYCYGRPFESFRNEYDIRYLNETEQIFQMLLSDRLDIGIVNLEEVQHRYQNYIQQKNIDIICAPFLCLPDYIGFSKVKNNYTIAKKFADAYMKYKATSEYQDLQKKYFENKSQE